MDTRSIKIVHLKNPVSIIDIERFSERFGIISAEDEISTTSNICAENDISAIGNISAGGNITAVAFYENSDKSSTFACFNVNQIMSNFDDVIIWQIGFNGE